MKLVVILLVLIVFLGGAAMIFKEQIGKFWKEKMKSNRKTDAGINVDMESSNDLNILLDELEFGRKSEFSKKSAAVQEEDAQIEDNKEPTSDKGNYDWFINRKKEGRTTGWDFLETENDEKLKPLDFLEEVESMPVLKYYITDELHRKVGEGVIDEEQLPFIIGRDPERTDLFIDDQPDSDGNYVIGRQFIKIDRVNALFKVERITNPDFGMMIRDEEGLIKKICKPVFIDEKIEMIISRPRNPGDIKVKELHISLYDYEDEYDYEEEPAGEGAFANEAAAPKTQIMPEKETEEDDFDFW